jgi:hypothetical protein
MKFMNIKRNLNITVYGNNPSKTEEMLRKVRVKFLYSSAYFK